MVIGVSIDMGTRYKLGFRVVSRGFGFRAVI